MVPISQKETTLKIHMKFLETLVVKSMLNKKNKATGVILPYFKILQNNRNDNMVMA